MHFDTHGGSCRLISLRRWYYFCVRILFRSTPTISKAELIRHSLMLYKLFLLVLPSVMRNTRDPLLKTTHLLSPRGEDKEMEVSDPRPPFSCLRKFVHRSRPHSVSSALRRYRPVSCRNAGFSKRICSAFPRPWLLRSFWK